MVLACYVMRREERGNFLCAWHINFRSDISLTNNYCGLQLR